MSIQAIGNTAGAPPVQPASGIAAQPGIAKTDDGSNTSAAAATQNLQPTGKELQAALDKLKKAADASSSDLQFSVDKDSGKTIVRVVDKGTGDLIRQIPSEDVLEIAKSIDKLQGLLIKKEA